MNLTSEKIIIEERFIALDKNQHSYYSIYSHYVMTNMGLYEQK